MKNKIFYILLWLFVFIMPTTLYSVNPKNVVGEIPCNSSISDQGSVLVDVPIEVYQDPRGMSPKLSFAYNSMSGYGNMGYGWSVSGGSCITHGNKSIYYDRQVESMDLTSVDAMFLDGVRLVRVESSYRNQTVNYQTVSGNITVVAHGVDTSDYLKIDESVWYEVFYPNGSKALYRRYKNVAYRTELTNRFGRKIKYLYETKSGHRVLSRITYGNELLDAHGEVQFFYKPISDSTTRNLYCVGGTKNTLDYLLDYVVASYNNKTFRRYDINYEEKDGSFFVSSIKCSAGNEYYTPLSFSYNNDNLMTGSSSEEIDQIRLKLKDCSSKLRGNRIVRGKFNFGNDNDGIVVFPDLYPYAYNHYLVNEYKGTESVEILGSVDDKLSSPYLSLTTGKGFIDVITSPLDDENGDEIIKINNIKENTGTGDRDVVCFSVYHVKNGVVELKYERKYDFYTPEEFKNVDKSNYKRVGPKKFLVGDYDGDGRNEMLVAGSGSGRKHGCLLIDLERDKILYKNLNDKLFYEYVPYTYVPVAKNTNPYDAWQEKVEREYKLSDKVFVCDFDCDGKSEILVVKTNGEVWLYSFCKEGKFECKQTVLNAPEKIEYDGRRIYLGEFNGDGLCDLILSPKRDSESKTWTIYANTGGGSFDKYCVDICDFKNGESFFIHDMNMDGQTDVVKFYKGFLSVNFIANLRKIDCYDIAVSDKTNVVPADIWSGNTWYSILTVTSRGENDWAFAHKYRYNKSLGVNHNLMNKAVNSLGLETKFEYAGLNDFYGDVYSSSDDAKFPYKNYKGNMSVGSNMSISYKGKKIHNVDYEYKDAIIHCQGLGFCGFSEVSLKDKVTGETSYKKYNPYNYGVLKCAEDNGTKVDYAYSVNVAQNKILTINVDTLKTLDKATLTKQQTTFTYDEYGNVLSEKHDFLDGINYVYKSSLYKNIVDGNKYILGLPYYTKTKNVRGESSSSVEHFMSYNNDYVLTKDTCKINSLFASATELDYKDGLISRKIECELAGAERSTLYDYDAEGRKTSITNYMNETESYEYNDKGEQVQVTDKLGNVTRYDYDTFGRLKKETSPDGNVCETEYKWSDGEANSVFKTITKQTGNKVAVCYYDVFGNVVRDENLRFDNTYLKEDMVYDERNMLAKKSLPYKGTEPSKWTTYKYDKFGRTIEVKYPSDELDKFTYNELETIYEKNGLKTVKTYDAIGKLVSVKEITADKEGEITYSYNADGNLKTACSPEGYVTSCEYDEYGRKVSLSDPSAGVSTIKYDNKGNISETEDARGKKIKYSYDEYDRLTKKEHVGEATYFYVYDEYNRIVSENGKNEKNYTFDALGRVSSVTNKGRNNKVFEKKYSYKDGNVSGVTYFYDGDSITSEKYSYTNGTLCSIDISDGSNVYKKLAEDECGRETKFGCGDIVNQQGYDSDNRVTSIFSRLKSGKALFDYAYGYDITTGNMISREDRKNGLLEKFKYDSMNRLTNYGDETNNYDDNGNIVYNTLVGSYEYTSKTKPYSVSFVENLNGSLTQQHALKYSAAGLVTEISGGNSKATITYNSDGNRVFMSFSNSSDGTKTYHKYYYDDKFEKIESRHNPEDLLYLGGDAYTANAVYRCTGNGDWNLYYILRDHLGSVSVIIDADGNVVQELSYDAWGNMRNPKTWELYVENAPKLLFGRGYTGHEHLQDFGLINMNARLYSPFLGRFFSPDPYVQAPDFSQSFNRYSYCLNNPLTYSDKSGKFAISTAIIAGAIISGVMNWRMNGMQLNAKGLGHFGVGALAGAAGGALASGLNVAMAGGSFMAGVAGTAGGVSSTGFMAGFACGASAGFARGFITNAGNSWIDGNGFFAGLGDGLRSGCIGALSDGAIGGIVGGVDAVSKHTNFFTGTAKLSLEGAYSCSEYGSVVAMQTEKSAKFVLGKYVGKYEGVNVFETDMLGICGEGTYSGYTLPGHGIVVAKGVYTLGLKGDVGMMQHEFGHILQARKVGAFGYYSIIAPESIHSATTNSMNGHRAFWTEKWANYMSKNYFGSSWNVVKTGYNYYPVKDGYKIFLQKYNALLRSFSYPPHLPY